jgi:hypothetical protein
MLSRSLIVPGETYQLIVPPEAAAAKATDPESQREFGVVEVIVN